MTVYVDNAGIDATVGRLRSRWSHLTADTPDELYEFADRLGLRREWFQTCKRRCSPAGQSCPHWHFDVTAPKRALAVRLGAQEIGLREMCALISARRAAAREATP